MKKKPNNIPALPDGCVYLGKGGEFEKLTPPRLFAGYMFNFTDKRWAKSSYLEGNSEDCHYCAPADSEIVKLNTPKEPAKLTGSPAYYYVYRLNFGAPCIRHATLADAQAEAERLATRNPGAEFEILRCVGISSTPLPTASTFWMDGESPEGGAL